MRGRYRLLLVIAVLLGIFYPSIFAELSTIDDQDMVTNILNLDNWNLRDVFLPGNAEGLYYRPLIHLSYILDRELWFLSSSFMHLENILLHLANSLLVFFLALRLTPEAEREQSYFPLAATLLFGLNPVNTESVNWVSGRTDLLAVFFVLSTSLLLVAFRSCQRKSLLFLAFCTFLVGVLAKEVALGFLPGGLLLLSAAKEEEGVIAGPGGKFALLRRAILILLVVSAFILAVSYLRSLAFASTKGGIPLTLRLIFDHPVNAAMVMLRAMGFYAKKLFFPFPLTFAITSVSPLYLLPGVAVAVLSLYLLFRRTVTAALFLAGVGLIIPSLPIAFGKIAWTPYAERYVYAASPFVLLAFLLIVRPFLRKPFSPLLVRVGLLALLGTMAAATFHRNFVWLSNLSLFEDTVAKNPGFARIRGEYGIALARAGRYEEAKYQLRTAGELPNPYYNEKYALNHAIVLASENDPAGAEKVYEEVMRATKESSPLVYSHIFSFYSKRLLNAAGKEQKKLIVHKVVPYHLLHYQKFRDPDDFYQVGRLYWSVGEKKKARASFKEALRLSPEGAKEHVLAEKALAKLGET